MVNTSAGSLSQDKSSFDMWHIPDLGARNDRASHNHLNNTEIILEHYNWIWFMRHSFVDGFCRYTQMDVFWFLQRKVVIAVRPISVLVSINL